jgi:hypothetical protein
LISVFKTELKENFESFGLVVVHLEVPDDINVVQSDVAVIVSDTSVLEQGFVVQVVFEFLLEQGVGRFYQILFDLNVTFIITEKYPNSH